MLELSVATRPSVATYISVPLGYLADTQQDVSSVIGAVQVALMDAVNASTDGLSVAALVAVANAVPGVSSTKFVTLNADFLDLPTGTYLIDVPAQVRVECWVIE